MERFPNADSKFKLKRSQNKSPFRVDKPTEALREEELVFVMPGKDPNPPSKLMPTNQVHLSELHSLFRNPKQFMWLFGVELEYHLPPKSYVTWPYMIQIVKGQKRLVKSRDITLTSQLPRFEQLSMKRVWPKFSSRRDINEYMPILNVGTNPPRRFFFEILHSKFPDDFVAVVNDAKEERMHKKKQANKVILAEPTLLNEIRSLEIWNNIASSKMSKRVLVNKSKRKKKARPGAIFQE